MFKIQTLNKISLAGLSLLERDKYETASEMTNPDGIILFFHRVPIHSKNVLTKGTVPAVLFLSEGNIVFQTFPPLKVYTQT